MTRMRTRCCAAAVVAAASTVLSAQQAQRPVVPMDPDRARGLYVSNRAEDHPPANYASAIEAKAADDKRYAEASKGVMDFQKVTYRSSVGDMDIPAYLFQPVKRRGAKGHAAKCGSTAGARNWVLKHVSFSQGAESAESHRHEYRGSTGYGGRHKASNTANTRRRRDECGLYRKALTHGTDRLGSGDGATAVPHAVTVSGSDAVKGRRDGEGRTSCSVRLQGPRVPAQLFDASRSRGCRTRSACIHRRSRLHVDKLTTPLAVHVPQRQGRDFVEARDSGRAEVAQAGPRENRVYVDHPNGGRAGDAFNRRSEPKRCRASFPRAIDAWNRDVDVIEWPLRPYADPPPPPPVRVR